MLWFSGRTSFLRIFSHPIVLRSFLFLLYLSLISILFKHVILENKNPSFFAYFGIIFSNEKCHLFSILIHFSLILLLIRLDGFRKNSDQNFLLLLGIFLCILDMIVDINLQGFRLDKNWTMLWARKQVLFWLNTAILKSNFYYSSYFYLVSYFAPCLLLNLITCCLFYKAYTCLDYFFFSISWKKLYWRPIRILTLNNGDTPK